MSVRLAMTLLVRDERDIIEHNIRYHAAQGVDYFLVTDNGSVDGTREILASLSSEFDLDVIDEPSHTIDQDLWVTRMADQLSARATEDWVIHNDADEFWMPSKGDLKDSLSADITPENGRTEATTVLVCPRHNVLACQDDIDRADYQFFYNRMKVVNPLGVHEAMPDPDERMRFSNALRALPGKIMCQVQGTNFISQGNHNVSHQAGARRDSRRIDICHFPVRGYEQFQVKVRNYGESLEANKRFDREVSWHLRRWFSLYERGELYDEYLEFVLDEDALTELLSKKIIENDDRLWLFFSESGTSVN